MLVQVPIARRANSKCTTSILEKPSMKQIRGKEGGQRRARSNRSWVVQMPAGTPNPPNPHRTNLGQRGNKEKGFPNPPTPRDASSAATCAAKGSGRRGKCPRRPLLWEPGLAQNSVPLPGAGKPRGTAPRAAPGWCTTTSTSSTGKHP